MVMRLIRRTAWFLLAAFAASCTIHPVPPSTKVEGNRAAGAALGFAQPGVELHCPAQADAAGPIPITVKIAAGDATYRANNANLVRALTIALIRRDAPGIRFLSSIPPNVILAPDIPYPADLPGQKPPDGVVREDVTVSPLDWGATHDGSADYAVIAAFATWTTGPAPLRVNHAARRLPYHDAQPAPPASAAAGALPPPPQSRGLVIALANNGGQARIEGAFRAAVPRTTFPGETPSPAFITVFSARLDAQGGAEGRSFLVTAEVQGGDYVGRFSLPLSLVASAAGKYRLFVFSVGENAPPLDVEVP